MAQSASQEEVQTDCHILLYGASGSGKSTIANELIGTDIILGVTTKCSTTSSHEYTVTDTIGVKETTLGSMPHKVALFRIRKYVETLNTPLHHVCFVKEAGPFSDTDVESFNEFADIFANCKENMVIIITHTNATWVRKNESTIQQRIKHKIPVIGIDLVNDLEKSLDELEKKLNTIRSTPGFTPNYVKT